MGIWQDRPILVTGATGLLGGWLTKRLIDLNANVICLVRDWNPNCLFVRNELKESVYVVQGDIADQRLLERILGEYEIESVFHLAAQTIVGIANRNPVSTFQSNIKGTWSLLEACRRSPKVQSIVVASTDKSYREDCELPYKEDMALGGSYPYDVSKSCTDLIAQCYGKTYKLPVSITRCGNLYGGGDLNWNRVIPGTIRSVIRGEQPVIRSDGKFVRDYVYIEDAVNAYINLSRLLSENEALYGQAFNFSNDTPMNVLQIVDSVLTLMHSKLKPIIQNQASNEILEQSLSSEKAYKLLGWKSEYTLEQGLTETIRWYGGYFSER